MNEDIKIVNGVTYDAVESPHDNCDGCAFDDGKPGCIMSPDCQGLYRADGREVTWVRRHAYIKPEVIEAVEKITGRPLKRDSKWGSW